MVKLKLIVCHSLMPTFFYFYIIIALLYIVNYTFTAASAEDKGLPESTIIAIACLASFITIVIVLSTVCYCYR